MAGSQVLLWVAAGVIGLVSVAPGLDRSVPDAVPADASGGYAIMRAPDGQFYVDGKVGETNVRFLVDPDADKVLIAGPDAERLGLIAGEGGNVTLASLAVGPTQQQAVAAQIAPAMPVSLLGRAYLSRLAAAEVRGNRLILR